MQGKAYYYISLEEFQKLEDNDELIEKAIVYGDKRGVTKKELERVQAQKDKVGTWKIDFKGLVTAKKIFPDNIGLTGTNIKEILEYIISINDIILIPAGINNLFKLCTFILNL